MIYLDYAASTPVDEEVLNNFIQVTKQYYANPNSNHKMGHDAKQLIDQATNNISNIFKVNHDEIIYTSGATESNNLAIRGVALRYKNRGKHILVSSLEHNSILSICADLQTLGFEVDLIPINSNGLIDINTLEQMIRPDTILVSICSIDSEIGLVQPIEKIGKILTKYPNIIFHTDASQAIGKANMNYENCDLITVAPHKFYGLNGISILIKKRNVFLQPLILGGKSTTIYRSGTPITAMISSTSIALQKAVDNIDQRNEYIEKLHNIIIDKLKEYKDVHINNTDNSIPHTLNISIKGVKADIFVAKLNENNVMVSTKTSCCPLNTPSKLIYALTKDKSLANTSIRISLSHLTTLNEVNEFLVIFDKCYKELVYGKI